MNKLFALGLTLLLATAPLAANAASFESDKELSSYALGQKLGQDLRLNNVELDPALVAQGMSDALAGNSKLSDEKLAEGMQKLQESIMMAHMAKQQQLAEANLKEGQKFLADNAKKKGVKTTASGLQYQVVSQGKGKKPTPASSVTVHYSGTLIDGTEFDSSIKRGTPATFPVNGVIPGWTEALQLMQEGAKYKLFIPSELAYGEQGAGDVIAPNSVLIFDVELIKVD